MRKDTKRMVVPGFRLVRDSEAVVAGWTTVKQINLSSTEAAYRFLKPFAEQEEVELCWVLPLDQENRLLTPGPLVISRGAVTEGCMNPSLVFRPAIAVFAQSVIAAHSHPGGAARPSPEDDTVTEQLRAAGELLGIELLDHLIIAPRKFYSYAQKGKL